MTIKNVLLLGADGALGPAVLDELVKAQYNVTVLKRSGSHSPDKYAPGVHIRRIADDFPHAQLVDVFSGQDAVVLTIKASQLDLQKRIARACVEARVQRLIPADFGSCDSSTHKAQELVPLFKRKTELRTHLTELATQHHTFTWTSLVSGHFFDWLDFVKIHLKERRIEILDKGDLRASLSTRRRIGEAVVHVLQRPQATANRVCFMQSFCVTQQQIVKSFEKATKSEWKVDVHDSAAYEKAELAKRDRGDVDAIENLVWLLGVLDGDWEKKDGFAMELLGLKNEDLDEVVADIVKTNSV